MLDPGQQLGPFHIREVLGVGGAGQVLRAFDERTQREVALKLLHAASPRSLARFEREAQLLASLRHEGILRIHEAGQLGGLHYLSCELVPGARSLDDVRREVDRAGQLDLVRQAAAALAHAHAAGITHRDVKPDNLLVRDGRVIVADFGVSIADTADRLTRTGELVGTPAYMAPEQLAAERDAIGPPADVWALGVILYECLADERPFAADNLMALYGQHAAGSEAALRRLQAPRALVAILRRCLATDPARRYPDAGALAAALAQVDTARGRGRARGPAFVAVCAAALLAGWLAWPDALTARSPAPAVTESRTPATPGPTAVTPEGPPLSERWATVNAARAALSAESDPAQRRQLALTLQRDCLRQPLLSLRVTEGPGTVGVRPEGETWLVYGQAGLQRWSAYGERREVLLELPVRAVVPAPRGYVALGVNGEGRWVRPGQPPQPVGLPPLVDFLAGNGHRLAVSLRDRRVFLFQRPDEPGRQVLHPGSYVHDLTFSDGPDGPLHVISAQSNELEHDPPTWSTLDAESTRRVEVHALARRITLHDAADLAAVGAETGQITLYRASTAERLLRLVGEQVPNNEFLGAAHHTMVRHLVFTADASTLFSTSHMPPDTAELRSWDLATGAERHPPLYLPAAPVSLALLEGERELILGLDDGTLQVWAVAPAVD